MQCLPRGHPDRIRRLELTATEGSHAGTKYFSEKGSIVEAEGDAPGRKCIGAYTKKNRQQKKEEHDLDEERGRSEKIDIRHCGEAKERSLCHPHLPGNKADHE